MHLTALFPQFRGLRIDRVCVETAGVILIATTTAPTAECPLCHYCGDRVHSRYRRRVADWS